MKLKLFRYFFYFSVGSYFVLFLAVPNVVAQNDVMMQAFYWDVPVDDASRNGTWWDSLAVKSDELKQSGFTCLWLPSPAKGNWGIYDMGYGIYDHYDLGNYLQKGSVETRFGSRNELENMIEAMHDTMGGRPRMELLADIILNHIYGSEENMENNPAVKAYTFDEAVRQFVPYPSNEITWVLPNAQPGEYYIKIKGFGLDFSLPVFNRGYDLQVDYTGRGFSGSHFWEMEPNNGLGFYNCLPSSGITARGFIHYAGDVDEYLLQVDSVSDIVLKLTAFELSGNQWIWSDQTKGFYPVEIWYQGRSLAINHLQAHTATGIRYCEHTGPGEKNYQWNYHHFHPSDEDDWLGDWGMDDVIISNTKGYGNDLNTFSDSVQQRMNDWGRWLVEEVGFDGFRLDFVRGFQESYAASWINNLPEKDGRQRFIVGEYWGGAHRIHHWVNKMSELGTQVHAFDFPLKQLLTELCNGNAAFDMRKLNTAGLVRNAAGYGLSGSNVVTFLENHDTGKEHDKWVTKDWRLGYAYLLTHQGRPCVFYPHFFGVTLRDFNDGTHAVKIPSELKVEIQKLMFVRRIDLGGATAVLSEAGNPFPEDDAANVYVARRQGNGSKRGAIVVINNSEVTKGLWVDSTPGGWDDWSTQLLVNAFDQRQTTLVAADGRVWVEAPARGYVVYVLKDECIEY